MKRTIPIKDVKDMVYYEMRMINKKYSPSDTLKSIITDLDLYSVGQSYKL